MTRVASLSASVPLVSLELGFCGGVNFLAGEHCSTFLILPSHSSGWNGLLRVVLL